MTLQHAYIYIYISLSLLAPLPAHGPVKTHPFAKLTFYPGSVRTEGREGRSPDMQDRHAVCSLSKLLMMCTKPRCKHRFDQVDALASPSTYNASTQSQPSQENSTEASGDLYKLACGGTCMIRGLLSCDAKEPKTKPARLLCFLKQGNSSKLSKLSRRSHA